MFRSFNEIEQYLGDEHIVKRVVLAGAHDALALAAVVRAKRNGFVEPILVGDSEKTSVLLREMGELPDDYRIIEAATENKAARIAIQLVASGEADFPMKGLMQTATFLMSLKLGGLSDADSLVNECTVFHMREQNRLVAVGDCAVNIAPSLSEKKSITNKLIEVARSFAASPIRVAQLSVIEKPEPSIQSSMDAQMLASMDWGSDVICEGPLALDNALDAQAAAHKGMQSRVAGKPDVIVVPDIHAGNVFHKCIHFFGHYDFASLLVGAKVPVVMNSRTDSEDAKYFSVLLATLQADALQNA